jgi:hypothetical protein
MKKIFKAVMAAILPIFCSGCLVAAVGAGIGAAKYGSAKQKEAYATYITGAEANNTEREKAGLKPNVIITYEEWHKGPGKDAGEAKAEKK